MNAPLAQLDRASDYESEGREFESLRAHQKKNRATDTFRSFAFNNPRHFGETGLEEISMVSLELRSFAHSDQLTAREKRQAANAVVQMLEADVFKKSVLELDKAFKRESLPVWIGLLLHDGIWFTCPEGVRGTSQATD